MMECKCDCLLNIDGKCTRQSKENMTALEKWKNDFKEFISELSMPRDDYKGIMEYIDEVPNEALEQQPCKDWHDVPSDEMTLEQARQAVKDLRKKLAENLEQEPCEDCISRQAVIKLLSYDWANRPAHKAVESIRNLPSVTSQRQSEDTAKAFQIGMAFGFGEKHDEMDKVIDEIKKAVTPEQQPCEDCISRQAVLNYQQTFTDNAGYETQYVDVEDVKALPPVTPKEKTGHWKEVYAETDYRDGWIEFSCENCEYQHGLESGQYGWSYGAPIPWKYCPICGAKMVEPQESEDNG